MPLFDYTGQLQSGQNFQGTLEAESRHHAEAVLSDMGVRVLTLRPAKRFGYVAPLSLDDFRYMNEQIATLTTAGLPLEPGLRAMASESGSRRLKSTLLELADLLAAGISLDEALKRQESRYPSAYAGTIRAGIRSGDLGGTLYAVSSHLRLKGEVRRAIIELACYPAIVLLFVLLLTSFVMRGIVPEMRKVFRDFGVKTFPSVTEWLFSVADAWPTVEIAILAFAACILAICCALTLPFMAKVREAILRRTPGLGSVYWSSALARFTHTASLASLHGAPLPDLLRSAGQASGSPALARAGSNAAEAIERGSSLEVAIPPQSSIPPLWRTAVEFSGPIGELPGALRELARAYEIRADQRARVVRVLLAPFLLTCIGVILLSVVIAILLPFAHLIQSLT